MLEGPAPRLFALPPGADFPAGLIRGLEDRLAQAPPEAWARVTIFVNTGRMQRRLRALFDAGPPRLVPRIRLVADLAAAAGFPDIPPATGGLALRLDLAALIRRLIAADPGLAPREAAVDLADSLAALIDEMEGEGVGPEALAALDVAGHAAHWQRSRAIVEAAYAHFGRRGDVLPGPEARRRRVVAALAARWAQAPPADPVLVAGSTGSRGTTRALMAAVARLPQGAVILPGHDSDMPEDVWPELDSALAAEDHPQFRARALMRDLGLGPEDVRPWSDAAPPVPARNRLLSLALRPAPVTDRWRTEGGALTGLAEATAGMTLIEAPHPRAEAAALALRLREAVAAGRPAALVTPDRELARQVEAALDRWGIVADDSAGLPLHQSAPGRLLIQSAAALEQAPDLPGLLALLKHPLVASGAERGDHLRHVRDLELRLRRRAVARPGPADLAAFGATGDRAAWAGWAGGLLAGLGRGGTRPLADHVAAHLALAETLARGPDGAGAGTLWDAAAGAEAQAAMAELAAAGEAPLEPADYRALVAQHLSARAAQDPRLSHPGVAIWGTLEARVGGADLTLLAGLNDGTWPDTAPPDPWLNRQMRDACGLLLPERRIGLAAHDFQQAAAAREVVLSRSRRDADAETVPSRWLNRLTNLLHGLGPEGAAALEAMRARGARLLAAAARLDMPEAPAPRAARPSPRPPVAARPRELPVTGVTTLIRDPYAIYARYVLGLRRLDPLAPLADARARGVALHAAMQRLLAGHADWRDDPAAARARLLACAETAFAEVTPVPSMRAFWLARLAAVADRVIAAETARLAEGRPVLTEETGACEVAETGLRLTARPDRIDRRHDGSYAVWDYKTGTPPSPEQVRHFEKQLVLEAALLERGAFDGLPPAPVGRMGYIALGASGRDREIPVETEAGRSPDEAWAGLVALLSGYARRGQGYTARRAAEAERFEGDYDHLARYGEWDLTMPPEPCEVG